MTTIKDGRDLYRKRHPKKTDPPAVDESTEGTEGDEERAPTVADGARQWRERNPSRFA